MATTPIAPAAFPPADVLDKIVTILHRHTQGALERAAIRVDTPLVDDGLALDSIQLLEAILEIEREFGIRLREEELTVQALSSVGALSAHVRGRIHAPPAGP